MPMGLGMARHIVHRAGEALGEPVLQMREAIGTHAYALLNTDETTQAWASLYLPAAPTLELCGHDLVSGDGGDGTRITAQLVVDGAPRTVTGAGNGPIAAFVDALRSELGVEMDVVDYAEHALGQGADATAVAYVETIARDGSLWWGVGTHQNIITASLRAVLSALARQPR